MDTARHCLQKDKPAEIPTSLLPGHHWVYKNIKFSPLLQGGTAGSPCPHTPGWAERDCQAEEGDQHSVCDTKCWPVPNL